MLSDSFLSSFFNQQDKYNKIFLVLNNGSKIIIPSPLRIGKAYNWNKSYRFDKAH